MTASAPDYYEILGVAKNATTEEITKAYRSLSRQFHPDKAGSQGTEKMQELNKVYAVLKDEGKRADYDAGFNPDEDINAADLFDFIMKNVKRVTPADVEAFFAGREQHADDGSRMVSADEDRDLRERYVEFQGNVKKMMNYVVGFEKHTRKLFEQHVASLIENGELPDLPAFRTTASIYQPPKTAKKAASASSSAAEEPPKTKRPRTMKS
jgi:DnaJ-class molecular chaperone